MLLQRFVDAAILAYECGMNEDSLRHELKVYKQSLEQQVAPPGMVGCNFVVLCSVAHCSAEARQPTAALGLSSSSTQQAAFVCSGLAENPSLQLLS